MPIADYSNVNRLGALGAVGSGADSSSTIGGVVLAAGLSRRFGHNKLLMPILGKPLVRYVVEAALGSQLAPIVVVLGHEQARVRAALSDLQTESRLILIQNDCYQQGQGSSVIAGLTAIEPTVEAAMFLPADQPWLSADVINCLISAFGRTKADICHPVVAGRRYSPVIFGARHFPSLRALRGDTGGRGILDANPDAVTAVAFENEAPFLDIDTQDDFMELRFTSPMALSTCHRSDTDLLGSLGLDGSCITAICGAGGKTSLMVALVRELAARGERILATTTTKMAIEESDGPWRPYKIDNEDDLRICTEGDSAASLAYHSVDQSRGKLVGLMPETIDAIARMGHFTRIIVEADGAARKPLKAPAPREPVFPCTTDTVVMVAGASGLGQPLDERAVFRADIWSALTGLQAGHPVTPESLARIIVHAEGLGKGAPKQARRLVFINQVDTPERLSAADHVLDRVFNLGGLVPDRATAGWLMPTPVVRLIRERKRQNEAST